MAIPLKEYFNIFGKGLLLEMSPGIFQGFLVTWLKKVSVEEAIDWINQNASLWDAISSDYQERARYLASKAGNIDWLTAEWLIQAAKKDCPALASLFLGWRKGHNWLVRQVKIIRSELTKTE